MEKKKRQLLDDTFQTFMEVGFGKRNYDILVDITSKDFVGFGTAIDEKIFGISDVQDLIQRQREQGKELEMSFETDTLDIHLSQDENTAIYTNDVVIHIVTGSDTIDMYVRISMVLEYIEDKWKAVHFHSSKPEQVQSEKDTWGIESWKERAEILEKEVAERTADLVLKNRALELENALERVRAIAMGMQTPEDLADVGKIIFDELKSLGFEQLRNTEIIINHEEKESIRSYYYSDDGVTGNIEVFYRDNPIILNWAKELGKANNAFAKVEIHKNEIKDWIKYREEIGYQPDPKLNRASEVYYYSYSTGLGALSISSFAPIPKHQIKILERFRNVFGLSYQRYADIKKAQEQAREAQIEAALERTRTQSMLMQHSHELNEISKVFHEQLLGLGIDSEFSFVWLPDEEKVEHLFWATWQTKKNGKAKIQSKSIAYPMDLSEPTTLACMADWKSGVSIHEHFIPPPEIKTFFASWEELLRGAEKLKPQNFPDGIYYTEAFMKYGCFGIDIRRPLSAQEKTILNRFAIEFERAYTRFLDLQKAEAQTREAQVEAALERVRAASMAMHRSEELSSVAYVLYEQLRNLGENLWGTGFGFCTENSKEDLFWFANENGILPPVFVPHTKDPAHKTMYAGWEEGSDFVSIAKGGKSLKKHYDYMLGLPNVKPFFQDILDAGLVFPEWQEWNAAYFSHGYLLVITLEPYKDREILKRFASVFEQAYTRFLDLQKAEKQAREAQIEAALERVRAQTMAMHNSEDVGKCIVKMFGELTALGVHEGTRFGIGILNHNNENNQLWTAKKEEEEVKMHVGNLDMTSHPLLISARKAWKDQIALHTYILEGEDLLNYYSMLNKAPDYKIQIPLDRLPEKEFHYGFILEHGFFYAFSPKKFEPDLIAIIHRFSSQFSQTYRRYLDLVKAEAQAREAQIEAALERVRAQTMAMHTTDELQKVVLVIVEKLLDLGVILDANGITLCTYFPNSKDVQHWIASPDFSHVGKYLLPYFDHIIFSEAWNSKVSGDSYFSKEYSVEDKNSFFEYAFEHSDYKNFPEEVKQWIFQNDKHILSFAWQNNSAILIPSNTGVVPNESEKEILIRFSKVFEQAYVRFLDLQKAEAQAREAQIMASMERVRAATMAMHRSDELSLVLSKLFEQFDVLGIHPSHAVLTLINQEKNTLSFRTTGKRGHHVMGEQEVDLNIVDAWVDTTEKWKKSEPNAVNVNEYPVDILPEVWEVYKDILNSMPKKARPEIKDFPNGLFITEGYCKFGYIGFAHHRKPTEEEKDIVRRIAIEFGGLYQRFLDLKKSEAQAREAKIEAALERVRSRTMGMQHSDELPEVANLMFLEIQSLGIPAWSCGYCILLEDQRSSTCIMSSEGTLQKPFMLPHHGEVSFEEWDKFVQGKDSFFVQELGGESLQSHYSFMKSLPQLTPVFQDLEDAGLSLPSYQINHLCKFGQGFLLFITYEKVPETHSVFRRFTKVFDQTYTRFLDLQKAEAQAREAKIEAALERVRSHSMGMQNSGDFGNVTTEMFNQLRNFGADLFATGIVFCDKHEGHVEQWHSIPGGGMLSPMIVPIDLDYIHQYRYDQWKAGKELFSVEIPEDFIEQHFEDIFKLPSAQITMKDLESRNAPMPKTPPWEIDYGASFKHGYILISSLRHFENTDILPRFAKVFEQAYTRFLDLQIAEAQAREAQIEAALERVRSRTLAMQNSDELAETAVVVFKQLIDLGIEPNRLYFGIITDNSGDIEFWATDEDGSKISSKFTGNKNDNSSLQKMYDAWLAKEKSLTIDMQGKELEEYFNYLGNELHVPFREGLLQKRRVQTMSFFSKGFIGMASPDEQAKESLEILERFAHAFNLTFTRFNDLKLAEASARQAEKDLIAIKEAKQKAEMALAELKSAQAQLIHAEKMASLGELTAGIAHEIQNPLNFVNNFAEVSAELIDEAEEERQKKQEERDEELVTDIMADLKENLKKINHHGKRADAIVKGMLEHSRANKGEKVSTDLNALTDEYVRLSYHGLRAKDKDFNAHYKLELDPDLPKVNVVPSDIGRVILNLVNNAFYACADRSRSTVNEKAKNGKQDYKPEVIVRTRMDKKGIQISVTDNGSGIPDTMKEKIFQPFFTTKPTGSGTGLGLSLSYDIVKAHRGEISVNTKENEGTAFTIQLPN